MHDVLRARVLRRLESLPETQVYQVLDYIEFLESKYAALEADAPVGGFQKMAERIEDRLRKSSIKPSNVREAFQVLAAAERAMSGVTKAGRKLFDELAGGGGEEGEDRRAAEERRGAGRGREPRREEPGG